jgi:outer membrane immunogenic protein
MRTTVLAILLAGVAMPAFAADMPVKAPYREPAVVNNWTGFYIGGHVGHGWSKFKDIDDADLVAFFTGDSFSSPEPKGFVGGIHGGYNWQVSSFLVLGIEGDFSFSGMKQTQTLNVPGALTVISPTIGGLACVNCDLQDSLRVKIDNLASVRGRLGFLATPNFMLYGTGGAAWAEVNVDVNGSATFTNAAVPAGLRGLQFANVSASGDKTFSGWVVGGGGEFMLTPNILLRIEYLHYDLGSKTVSVSGDVNRNAFTAAQAGFPISAFSVPVSADTKTSLTTDVIRGGVSFKF